ncbi:hypothetical protein DV737_g2108, partial [Chaetothyriales sp. CBS 132003]
MAHENNPNTIFLYVCANESNAKFDWTQIGDALGLKSGTAAMRWQRLKARLDKEGIPSQISASSKIDESTVYLSQCILTSAVKIDFAAVSKATGLKPGTAAMRYRRLLNKIKQHEDIEAGEEGASIAADDDSAAAATTPAKTAKTPGGPKKGRKRKMLAICITASTIDIFSPIPCLPLCTLTMADDSKPASHSSTPRFTSQVATAEDLLKSQTVGLVNLADFRKRRADALEQKEREAHEARSGANTPGIEDVDGTLTPNPAWTPGLKKPNKAPKASPDAGSLGKKLAPNPNSAIPAPKAKTKATLTADALERERLRKEFLDLQEKVRNTEVAVPFVFHDGNNIPGGVVKVKKGDRAWLILERARKIGAETGAGGSGSKGGGTNHRGKGDNRRQWARVGVDDLMLLRGEVIIPHHYEIYYFIVNKTPDPFRQGKVLFDYAGVAEVDAEDSAQGEDAQLLGVLGKEKLEGHDDDPTYTKVVDRRWYERNKHIYPASTWKQFKADKQFDDGTHGKTDVEGNAFFFS